MARRYHLVLAIGIVVLCAAVPVFMGSSVRGGEKKEFFIKASQYAYDPPRIIVNQGDQVHLRMASLDVVHGFFLEGYDINALVEPGAIVGDKWPTFKFRRPSQSKEYTVVEEVVFTADRPGKFRYRCSHTCGNMHPFMQGELIVRPNYPYLAAIGATVGMVIAAFVIWFMHARTAGKPTPQIASATDV